MALRWALDPGQYWVTSLPQLRFTHATPLCYIGKISEKISGAPIDQILDPLVNRDHKMQKWEEIATVLGEEGT